MKLGNKLRVERFKVRLERFKHFVFVLFIWILGVATGLSSLIAYQEYAGWVVSPIHFSGGVELPLKGDAVMRADRLDSQEQELGEYDPCGLEVVVCEGEESPSATIEELVREAFGEEGDLAVAVFNCESGLNPLSHSRIDLMQDGRAFSVGLAQINLTVSEIAGIDCTKAFSGKNKNAVVVDENLYSKCVELAENPKHNIDSAKEKHIKNGFQPWLWCANKNKAI